jgi:branched-chain amino acid transport system substrate-binding protein
MTYSARANRRRFLQTSGAAAATIALPGLGIGNAFAQEKITIGMVIAKQGPFTQQGADLAAGIQMALAEAGGKVLGRTVDLQWLDEANPQGAVQSITKVIEEGKAVAVLGGTNSATTLAMGQVALRAKVPFISVNGAAREITGKDCNPFMFRSQPSVPVFAEAMAPHMLAIGKKWYFIAGAFAFGEDVISTFSDILKAAGGTVLGADRAPVGTTDYSSLVLKARAAKPDVVISGAANVEPLLKQFKELGLTGNIGMAGPAVSDTDLWSASPDALAGIFGKTWSYADPNNSPAEKAFVAAYRAKEGKPPSDRVFFGWYSMRFMLAAIQQSGGTDPVKITHALEEVKFQEGPTNAYFRKGDHQMVRRLLVAKAHKPNPADKWDILDIVSKPAPTQAALEKMYGVPAELGCKMAPIA